MHKDLEKKALLGDDMPVGEAERLFNYDPRGWFDQIVSFLNARDCRVPNCPDFRVALCTPDAQGAAAGSINLELPFPPKKRRKPVPFGTFTFRADFTKQQFIIASMDLMQNMGTVLGTGGLNLTRGDVANRLHRGVLHALIAFVYKVKQTSMAVDLSEALGLQPLFFRAGFLPNSKADLAPLFKGSKDPVQANTWLNRISADRTRLWAFADTQLGQDTLKKFSGYAYLDFENKAQRRRIEKWPGATVQAPQKG